MNGADKFHQVPSRKELRWTKAAQAWFTGNQNLCVFGFQAANELPKQEGDGQMSKKNKPFLCRATTWMFQEVRL